MQIFRRFKLQAKYGMILRCALLNCAAFAASPTAKQSIEKQSKLTIKPHLQNKSQHHQRLKTTVPQLNLLHAYWKPSRKIRTQLNHAELSILPHLLNIKTSRNAHRPHQRQRKPMIEIKKARMISGFSYCETF